MSLHNCSNDHTAVLSSVWSTCQRQVRGWASFPAQREFRRLIAAAKRSSELGWPRLGAGPPPPGPRTVCHAAGPPVFIYLRVYFLLTYFSVIYLFFARLRTSFIYECVNFREATLILKWTCKEPIEKQVPAALIMRTDKAFLLGLLMTFCLC